MLGEIDLLSDALGDTEVLGLMDLDSDALGLIDFDSDALGETDVLGERDLDADPEGLREYDAPPSCRYNLSIII